MVEGPSMGPTRTRLTFQPEVTPCAVCEAVQSLVLPLDQTSLHLARYALIEVVMNAVRASAERDAEGPVVAEVWFDPGKVHMMVADEAGGFDLGDLPYDFSADPYSVDPTAKEFAEYRVRYEYTRFGLGLLMVRRAVEGFRLAFVDRSGQEAPWRGVGSVAGTRISFALERKAGVPDE